jgi:hypothetical protein
MSIVELPVIQGGVSLAEAYETLKVSGKSGLVVVSSDGPRLFHAGALELQLPHGPGLPMQELAGGHWLPEAARAAGELTEGEPNLFIVRMAGGKAAIGGLLEDAARNLNFGVRVYSCSLYPTIHTYTAMQYRALPIVGGVRYCTTKDGGVVK